MKKDFYKNLYKVILSYCIVKQILTARKFMQENFQETN